MAAAGGVDAKRVGAMVVRRLPPLAVAVSVVVFAPAWWPIRAEAGSESEPVSALSNGDELAIVARARQATVRVVGRSCSSAAVGTGFVIDNPSRSSAALVTNAHLLGPDRRLKVDVPGRRFLSEPMIANAGTDLAIDDRAGEEAASVLRPLRAATDWVEPEDEVIAVGYPGGRRLEAHRARVRTVVDGGRYGVQGRVVLLDGSTALGYSGGPVLDRSGDVVAVLRGYDAVTGLIIAVHGEEVVELLSAGEDWKSRLAATTSGEDCGR